MNINELITVFEDLEYLRSEWAEGDVDEATIRRGSAILRRLLVEGVLGRAWRAAGFERQPYIVAPNLDGLLGQRNRANIEVALAGGAKTGGFVTAIACISRGDGEPMPAIQPGPDANTLLEYSFPLSDFNESIGACVQGETINRRTIIKYMANVRGGVHSESSRGRRRDEELIKRIQSLEEKINIHKFNGLFYELLSIGQALGNSNDTLKLIERIRSMRTNGI